MVRMRALCLITTSLVQGATSFVSRVREAVDPAREVISAERPAGCPSQPLQVYGRSGVSVTPHPIGTTRNHARWRIVASLRGQLEPHDRRGPRPRVRGAVPPARAD